MFWKLFFVIFSIVLCFIFPAHNVYAGVEDDTVNQIEVMDKQTVYFYKSGFFCDTSAMFLIMNRIRRARITPLRHIRYFCNRLIEIEQHYNKICLNACISLPEKFLTDKMNSLELYNTLKMVCKNMKGDEDVFYERLEVSDNLKPYSTVKDEAQKLNDILKQCNQRLMQYVFYYFSKTKIKELNDFQLTGMCFDLGKCEHEYFIDSVIQNYEAVFININDADKLEWFELVKYNFNRYSPKASLLDGRGMVNAHALSLFIERMKEQDPQAPQAPEVSRDTVLEIYKEYERVQVFNKSLSYAPLHPLEKPTAEGQIREFLSILKLPQSLHSQVYDILIECYKTMYIRYCQKILAAGFVYAFIFQEEYQYSDFLSAVFEQSSNQYCWRIKDENGAVRTLDGRPLYRNLSFANNQTSVSDSYDISVNDHFVSLLNTMSIFKILKPSLDDLKLVTAFQELKGRDFSNYIEGSLENFEERKKCFNTTHELTFYMQQLGELLRKESDSRASVKMEDCTYILTDLGETYDKHEPESTEETRSALLFAQEPGKVQMKFPKSSRVFERFIETMSPGIYVIRYFNKPKAKGKATYNVATGYSERYCMNISLPWIGSSSSGNYIKDYDHETTEVIVSKRDDKITLFSSAFYELMFSGPLTSAKLLGRLLCKCIDGEYLHFNYDIRVDMMRDDCDLAYIKLDDLKLYRFDVEEVQSESGSIVVKSDTGIE